MLREKMCCALHTTFSYNKSYINHKPMMYRREHEKMARTNTRNEHFIKTMTFFFRTIKIRKKSLKIKHL